MAKEARLFDKHGLDVAPCRSSSVRTLQAILAEKALIAESAGPRSLSAVAGGDVVALAGSVNISLTIPSTSPSIKRAEEAEGKNWRKRRVRGRSRDFALRVSLRKLGLDPAEGRQPAPPSACSHDRIAAMQKGIVRFQPCCTEAEKPIVDKLGLPGVYSI